MTDAPEAPEAPRPAGVPKPPSDADIAQVSQDQALIADEWGDAPPPGGPAPDAPGTERA
jgi:hypothetical protein